MKAESSKETGALVDLSIGKVGNSLPVSYTHLDVYKRQEDTLNPRRKR